MIPETELARFVAARDKIITLGPRERDSIGVQKEKTVHAILKNTIEPEELYQEVPVGGYIADICKENDIYEIQTANWGNLRGKLSAFLPEYHVTCVLPIPHIKWTIWIDPETGELLEKNKGTMRGTWYSAFRELYRIRPFLSDPQLSIRLYLLDMEEYRVKDGYGKDGKRGSHRYDRIPLSIHDILQLDTPSDYAQLIPESLPEEFTARDFQDAVKIHRKSVSFSTILRMLSELGLVEKCGLTQRRAFVWRRL